MTFSVQERCCCNAAIAVETGDSDGSQIFAADFVNAWRESHKHQVVSGVTPPESEVHVQVDSLVESGIGFRRGQGVEVQDG